MYRTLCLLWCRKLYDGFRCHYFSRLIRATFCPARRKPIHGGSCSAVRASQGRAKRIPKRRPKSCQLESIPHPIFVPTTCDEFFVGVQHAAPKCMNVPPWLIWALGCSMLHPYEELNDKFELCAAIAFAFKTERRHQIYSVRLQAEPPFTIPTSSAHAQSPS